MTQKVPFVGSLYVAVCDQSINSRLKFSIIKTDSVIS